MTRIVHAAIAVPPETLVVLDAERRLYAGLSRDESYYHVLQPALFALTDGDGNVVRPTGTLECRCRGFQSHGHCYVAAVAIALEARQADQAAMPEIFREPAPETELERAGARG